MAMSSNKKWIDNMERYINNEKNHDVTFVVGFDDNIKEIGCVKHFLAAQSIIFEKMLCGPLSNHNNNITINYVKPEIFKIMYHALCGLPFSINMDNFVDLCCISDQFLVDAWQDECLKFTKNISVFCNEPIKVLEIINSLMNKKLEKTATKALQHFVQSKGFTKDAGSILGSSEFMNSSFLVLKAIIGSDHLGIKESFIFEKTMKWVEHQTGTNDDIKEPPKKKRKLCHQTTALDSKSIQLMKKCCPFIRFSLIDPVYFTNNIAGTGILSKDEELRLALYFLDKQNKKRLKDVKKIWNISQRISVN